MEGIEAEGREVKPKAGAVLKTKKESEAGD